MTHDKKNGQAPRAVVKETSVQRPAAAQKAPSQEAPAQRLPTAQDNATYTALLWAGEKAARAGAKETAAPDRKTALAAQLRRLALWCERQTPPGRQAAGQLRAFGWGALAAAVYSLTFWWRLAAVALDLFDIHGAWRSGRIPLPPFGQLLGTALLGFWVLAAEMALYAVLYYAGLWQGSKSIYLMRRLPDRWELPRRCLTLPALGVLASVLCAGACCGAHYLVYLLAVWVYG